MATKPALYTGGGFSEATFVMEGTPTHEGRFGEIIDELRSELRMLFGTARLNGQHRVKMVTRRVRQRNDVDGLAVGESSPYVIQVEFVAGKSCSSWNIFFDDKDTENIRRLLVGEELPSKPELVPPVYRDLFSRSASRSPKTDEFPENGCSGVDIPDLTPGQQKVLSDPLQVAHTLLFLWGMTGEDGCTPKANLAEIYLEAYGLNTRQQVARFYQVYRKAGLIQRIHPNRGDGSFAITPKGKEFFQRYADTLRTSPKTQARITVLELKASAEEPMRSYLGDLNRENGLQGNGLSRSRRQGVIAERFRLERSLEYIDQVKESIRRLKVFCA